MKAGRSDVDGGWAYVVAIGNFMGFFLITGFARSFGIMYSAFLDTFRQPDSSTSLLMGIRSAVVILSGPVSTALSERFGERIIVMIGACLTAFSFILSYFANSLEFLIGTLGALQGIGSIFVLAPSFVVMGKYFDKKRSRAITLTSCGGCLGMIVVPILLQKLIEEYSVRGALLIYGGLMLNLVAYGAVLRPLDLGDSTVNGKRNQEQITDNSENGDLNLNASVNYDKSDIEFQGFGDGAIIKEKINISESSENMEMEHFLTKDLVQTEKTENRALHERDKRDETTTSGSCKNQTLQLYRSIRKSFDFSLMKNPLFLIILTSAVVSAIPYTTVTIFLVPLIESHGISRESAAILLSVMGGCDIVGRIVSGALADRRPLVPQHVMIATSLLGGVICCLFVVVSDFYSFLGLVIAYGLVNSGPNILVMPAIVNMIGLQHLSKAVGAALFFFGISTSIAPSMLGLLKDETKSYRPIFPLLGGLQLLAGFTLFLEPLVRRRQKRRDELAHSSGGIRVREISS